MQRTSSRTINNLAVVWQHTLSSAKKLALIILCGLLLVNSSFAQEGRPEPPPEPTTPETSTTQKPPDPNETVTPSPLANQVVDGDIVFTSPGQFTYPRDIRLSDNFGGLRFYGANSLTTTPAGAAIQFFGNNASPFNGQLYLDSGALNSAALIFRTAQTGGTITERMRIAANGNIGLAGATNPARAIQIGPRFDSLFTIEPTDDSPNAGFFRFGDNTGWRLLFGRQREFSGGPLNTGTTGTLMSLRDNGSVGIGTLGDALIRLTVAGGSSLSALFLGNVQVTGTLTKGGGSFKIDHPLDPENKYLSHSFVESPDMKNIYDGNVTTDATGQAVVTLPHYFTALNRDFRYQLTVIGRFAQAIVSREIKNNRFTIKTNKPGVKVSWQVTGIRQDAYAEAHRIQVEEEKTGAERGTYLHPEAFGQPKEKGVAQAQQPESNGRLTTVSAPRKEQ